MAKEESYTIWALTLTERRLMAAYHEGYEYGLAGDKLDNTDIGRFGSAIAAEWRRGWSHG